MEKLNMYGIFFLVGVYILINVFYKNIKSLVLFLVAMSVSMIFLKNKINAIIIAYIISIMYGIVTNFHLLENFSDKITIPASLNDIKPKEAKKSEADVEEQPKDLDFEKELFNSVYDIDEICNKVVLKQLLKKIKLMGISVTNTKIPYYNIYPTSNRLKSELVKQMMDSIRKNETTFNQPVYISNDNYIINGHYLWYCKEAFVQESSNTLINDKTNEELNVVKIDLTMKEFEKYLNKYNIEYNSLLVDKFNNNKQDMDKFKTAIETLDNSVSDLKQMFKNNYRIKLS